MCGASFSVFTIPIWQNRICRNWYFPVWLVFNFIWFAYQLELNFLWIGRVRSQPGFPWSGCYPTLHPAPAPVFFANIERCLAKILACIGSPLKMIWTNSIEIKRTLNWIKKLCSKSQQHFADLMQKCICHGSLSLNCSFFSLLYPINDLLHGFSTTTPFHLLVNHFLTIAIQISL